MNITCFVKLIVVYLEKIMKLIETYRWLYRKLSIGHNFALNALLN